MSGHRADLDEMRLVVESLEGRLLLLEELAERLTRGIVALEPTWTGNASGAHSTARAQWDAGFARMREALGDMRVVVRAAHDHYEAAAQANLARWRELG